MTRRMLHFLGLACGATMGWSCEAQSSHPTQQQQLLAVVGSSPCPGPPERPLREKQQRWGVEVRVVANAPLVVNPYYARVLDSENRMRSAVLWGCEPVLQATLLQAGEHTQGWLNFELPEDAQPTELEYALPDAPPLRVAVPDEEPVQKGADLPGQ